MSLNIILVARKEATESLSVTDKLWMRQEWRQGVVQRLLGKSQGT